MCLGVVQNCDISRIDKEVYDINTFPYQWFYDLPLLVHGKGESWKTKKIDYIHATCSFDIETTALPDIKQSICYIWQMAINNKCIIGRDPTDFKKFLDRLMKGSDPKTRLLVYIHNAPFEFHHFREILDFEEVFSTARRNPIKFNYRQVEFRCSYMLTNMSLNAFLKKMRVENKKTTMDYRRKRYPWSKLNAKDTEYCLHDVIGLNEGIDRLLETENDTLYTIPLTSTGYTRRDVKAAMWGFSRSDDFQQSIPDFNTFYELWEAFRGGNCHANRWYVGRLMDFKKWGLMHSRDKVSSYHDSILNHLFPGQFKPTDMQPEFLMQQGKAVLTRVIFKGIRIKDWFTGAPYIPLSKTRGCKGQFEDNGRIMSADFLIMTVTDIDLKIIWDQYEFDSAFYFDTQFSDYKPLPNKLKNVVRKYYRKKTSLKDVEGKEDEYNKYKGRFNAIYGLMVQNPCREMILYDQSVADLFRLDTSKSLEEIYNKHKHNLFLLYQWGVWITAWSRYELQLCIDQIQNTPDAGFLYSDTDSVKYFGDVDWSEYNDNKIMESTKNVAFAEDPNGKTHYIGVLEAEKDMKYFITQGAKKYAYIDINDDLHLTCSGVAKKSKGVKGTSSYRKSGSEELWVIDDFKEGKVFYESAGLEAKYNDCPEMRKYIVNGKSIIIYSNIYLSDSTYTVKRSAKYNSLLDTLEYFD